MLVKDINGKFYTLSHMYGMYTLKTIDNELIDYGLDYLDLIRRNLGYHAEIIDEKGRHHDCY